MLRCSRTRTRGTARCSNIRSPSRDTRRRSCPQTLSRPCFEANFVCILEPKMDRVDESEGSKAIALKAIRGVFIERDARVVQELFAPDYIQHNPIIPGGRDAISALVGSLPEGFRYEPGMVVAEGSIVMIHGRYVGWAPEPIFIPWFPLEAGELTRP